MVGAGGARGWWELLQREVANSASLKAAIQQLQTEVQQLRSEQIQKAGGDEQASAEMARLHCAISRLELEKAAARGIRTEGIGERYSAMLNAILEAKPADMTITTHVCRGNFRSTWISSGGYEPVAKHLLADTNYDGYFLEYDSDRAGGFEPLRFLPHGHKRVVLGLVTTKSGELEDADLLRTRIQEAAQFAPLEQLALSPQCGFASTEEGNLLTEDAADAYGGTLPESVRKAMADFFMRELAHGGGGERHDRRLHKRGHHVHDRAAASRGAV